MIILHSDWLYWILIYTTKLLVPYSTYWSVFYLQFLHFITVRHCVLLQTETTFFYDILRRHDCESFYLHGFTISHQYLKRERRISNVRGWFSHFSPPVCQHYNSIYWKHWKTHIRLTTRSRDCNLCSLTNQKFITVCTYVCTVSPTLLLIPKGYTRFRLY